MEEKKEKRRRRKKERRERERRVGMMKISINDSGWILGSQRDTALRIQYVQYRIWKQM